MKRDEQPVTDETIERLRGITRTATQYRLGLAVQRVEAAARAKEEAKKEYPHDQVRAVRAWYGSRDAEALRGCCEGFVRAVCKLVEESPEFPRFEGRPVKRGTYTHPCSDENRATGPCGRFA